MITTTLSRRGFIQVLGAGLLIAVAADPAEAQTESGVQSPPPSRRGGRGGGGAVPIAARIHIAKDGAITVMSGKVECGQGARAEIAQAAAQELRVPLDAVTVLLCDTSLTPNDGGTFGSATTPRTLPAVRTAAAAARLALLEIACRTWNVPADQAHASDGQILHPASGRHISYADLASSDDLPGAFAQTPRNVTLTPVSQWTVMGQPAFRRDQRDLVTGRHPYPTDITRPNMAYGKILRPPAFGATLVSLDTSAPQAPGVSLVHDGQFVGVVAPTTFAADQAIAALAPAAHWQGHDTVSSVGLADYLKAHVRGGLPANPFADQLAAAPHTLSQTYYVPYIQHAPLEPRTALAEWLDGKLTVWTATQNPFGVRSELARALNLAENDVCVIVPDFGGAFGGKHTGESAIEAARLAKAARRPVMLRWSRAEEFTWAYFRPAAVITVAAALDSAGKISAWHFLNINSGNAGLDSPYAIPNKRSQYLPSDPPLRHGSYRALAATANNFARELAMDELAALARKDPLAFRLDHIDDPRLRTVLQTAARKFNWGRPLPPGRAAGLACGVEKGSYVAACAEISLDNNALAVTRVTQAFDCGAVVNPAGLTQQIQGAITQGLGPSLWEHIEFNNGRILNAAFARYRLPRFSDLPAIDVQLVDRKDLPSAGAGETPIICIAPAVANAVSALTGKRIRELPIKI